MTANEQITIKIFSDIKDVSSIESSVSQLELKDFNIHSSSPKIFEVNPNEIIIIQINSIESKYLNKVLEEKDSLKNKIIFVTQNDSALLVSSLVKLGFYDIFVFPYELYKFIAYLNEIITNRSYQIQETAGLLSNDFDNFETLLGNSPEFIKIIDLAKKVAQKSNVNIMILGETGTGKGHLAKAIHKFGENSSSPFVDIVCTAIPESLLESELFGYEPGAFTNAQNRKLGLFEIAGNGTLFLDEIGDLSLNIQTKLLRTIEKKIIRRLGGVEDIKINSRVISATNKNLVELIENNSFRRDLYHRLNVISLELPPLRNRPEDIFLLAGHFISEFNTQFNKSIKTIEKSAREFISHYPWPGNIRELRNAIERAVLLGDGSKIMLKDFSNLLFVNLVKSGVPKEEENMLPQFIRLDINYMNTGLRKISVIYAKEVLSRTNGNKSQAAKILGISRPSLDALIS
ncbi:MAG: sigma-54 interaction domain-containing protein [Ignavibacteriaceae bacterium]